MSSAAVVIGALRVNDLRHKAHFKEYVYSINCKTQSESYANHPY